MNTRKLRSVVFHVKYYDRGTSRVIEKFIRGISVNLSEHADNPLFYITDEFNQDAFAIPYVNLLECTSRAAEKKVRAPSASKQKAATVSRLRATR